MRVRVDTGSRLHFGFQNLSLAHERLYGGVGLAVDAPGVTLEAEPADRIECSRSPFAEYTEQSCAVLGVDGAAIDVIEALPRHIGLGSGTQAALATLVAVARAHDRSVSVREHAPLLNRGGRSGVGVATFESGGFVVDAGHPTERFTTAPPEKGSWSVPAVTARHDVPSSWRFVLVLPEAERGRSGRDEDESMRTIVENADPSVADSLASLVTRRLLPAIAEERLEEFGDAVGAFGRLNGVWYADQQGGVYRPPAGRIIDALSDIAAVRGLGQSSWGPAVYGITDETMSETAVSATEAALSEIGIDGTIQLVAPRNTGVEIEELE